MSTPRHQGVYLMKCGEFHKIGISQNIGARLSQISGQTPFPVEVVHFQDFNIDAMDEFGEEGWAKAVERRWHLALKQWQHKREWFKLPPNVLEEIADAWWSEEYPDEDGQWRLTWDGGVL